VETRALRFAAVNAPAWRKALLVGALALGGVAALGPAHAVGAREPRAGHARLRDYFSEREIERSRSYWRTRYPLRFGSIAAGIIVLLALAFGPGARVLRETTERVSGGRWWAATALIALFIVITSTLALLPFGIARLYQDRRYGLSTQSLAGYLGDAGKGLAVEVVIAVVAAVGFVAIARWFPRQWPGVAAVAGMILTILLVFVAPAVFEPLFNRFRPVDPELRQRVMALAARAGVDVDRVLVADASRRTTTLNAYVSGLGATKRVVLYDTLLARSSPDEIDLVVAHELAHVAHRDELKSTAYSAAGVVAAVVLLWLLLSSTGVRTWARAGGPADPFVIPFVALVLALAALVTAPAATWASRRMEASADRSAIELTRDPQTAIRAEVSLAGSNIADLEPNRAIVWWFFSHPPTLERIEIARDWQRSHAA
jgi:Zn-dependent protease with chaperone function